MRFSLYVALIVYHLSSVNHVFGLEEASQNNSVFVPTDEWQVVKKGTPIPKGLHVRHNFQTGITEAKLLDPGESSSANNETPKSVVLHPDAPKELPENEDLESQRDDQSAKISPEELKAKLKEIKATKIPFTSKESSDGSKKGLKNLGFGKSSDTDLLEASIGKFNTQKQAVTSGSQNADQVKTIIDTLSQIEYLVHDIDNGLEFTRYGGLEKVIHPCLNSTNEEIKFEALRVLGAAVGSNPRVKEAALELEFVPSILRTLIKYENSKLRDRCIYALGSLVRNYPAAQKVFLDHGGLQIFSQILAEGSVSSQKRIMNLINDLIVERHELSDITDSELRKIKTEEYSVVKLDEKIVQHKFCTQLGNVLVKTTRDEIKTEFDIRDHDLLEAIYECALTTSDICNAEFRRNENEILTALNEISSIYDKLDLELYSDERDLVNRLLELMNKIRTTVFEKLHDEL